MKVKLRGSGRFQMEIRTNDVKRPKIATFCYAPGGGAKKHLSQSGIGKQAWKNAEERVLARVR